MGTIDILRGQNTLETGSYICSPSKPCFHTWQILATTPIPNLACYIYSRYQISQLSIPMLINILKRDYILPEEATACGLVCHLTLLLSKFWWEAWKLVEVLQEGVEWLRISIYCGCFQGLPVQKLIRQCRNSHNCNTGEQNKDMTAARQAHDWKDTLSVEQNPFSLDPSLQSISTGVHAHPTVNVDEAVAVGGHDIDRNKWY